MKRKQCSQCKRTKPLKAFWFHKRKRRYIAECRACMAKRREAYKAANRERLREANRRWQRENPERMAAAQARWKRRNPGLAAKRAAAWYRENRLLVRSRERTRYQEMKDQVYAAYGGRICSCCGETEPKFLSIDHVNNDGNVRRRQFAYGVGRNGGGMRLYAKIIELGFPPDYQVLCMNCNWGKARNGGVCPHETAKVQRLSRKGVRPSGRKRAAPQR